jgi:hypothetical protein
MKFDNNSIVLIIVAVFIIWYFYQENQAYKESFESQLYGLDGNLWNMNGRLLDYSYAGNIYNPDISKLTVYNIKNFGAKGDGITDDTIAFKTAFNNIDGILYIPSGKYIITDKIIRKKSGPFIIKGDGINKSIIKIPKSLRELNNSTLQKERAAPGGKASFYAFGPCFFEISPPDITKNETIICKITNSAKIGTRKLVVDTTPSRTLINKWILINMKDTPSGDLYKILYNYDNSLIPFDSTQEINLGKKDINIPNKIINIGENFIEFERPMPFNIDVVCSPTITTFNSLYNNFAGIQDISFDSTYKPYAGHLVEDGFNMVVFRNVCNGFANNLSFKNVDIGLMLLNCHFCISDNTIFESEKKRLGHHGIWLSQGSDNLINNFNFKSIFMHELTVEGRTIQNVFQNGKGINLAIDHHRWGPYGNLFTNIHVGLGTRYSQSSGQIQRGAHAGALNTFWRILTNKCNDKTSKCSKLPLPTGKKWGPSINFVGTFKDDKKYKDWHVDSSDNNKITPENLHTNMVQTKKTRLNISDVSIPTITLVQPPKM